MDGNVSRPANGGSNPAPFTEAAMAGYGATPSLPGVPAKVFLLITEPQPTLSLGGGNYSSCPIPDIAG